MVVNTYVNITVGNRLTCAWCGSKKIKKVFVLIKKEKRKTTNYLQ